MSTQRYSVTPHPIETLLTWVKSGEIAIPEIQRPFVWEPTKVRNLLDSLAAASPELVKSLAVGVELSGPLFDVAGKSVPLSRKLKLPDIGTILKDNPGAILDAAGSVFDAIKGNKKKNEPAPPPAPRNN